MIRLIGHDIDMIKYFIQEKGDVTRWCGWNKVKAQVGEEFPEVIAALKALDVAERTLSAVLEQMEDKFHE